MASGKEHAKAAKRATKTVAAMSYGMTIAATLPGDMTSPEAGAAFISATLIVLGMKQGEHVDPDYDMLTITKSERDKLDRRPFLGRVWLAWWAGYGALFTHRGLSHAPFVGTATRVFWLYWPVIMLLALVVYEGYLKLADLSVLIPFLLGWALQDMVHLHKDGWKFRWKL